ncbi:MAG: DPP IV N-terminal domain-containing protein [Gemmatimonadota bacterium]
MRCASFALVACLAASPLSGQAAPEPLTAEDYADAERFLAEHLSPLVLHGDVEATWLADGRFWYDNRIEGGVEHVIVDPDRRTHERAFDHQRMAVALSAVTGRAYDALDIPMTAFEPEGSVARLRLRDAGWLRCDLDDYGCAEIAPPPAAGSDEVASPDGRWAAFTRDDDLWVRDVASGAETRLTQDGTDDFGYATNNAGWVRGDRPVLKWSPDSRRIATFRHDARGVGMMYVTTTNVGHPELDAWRYPLPEDSVIFRIHRIVVDLDRPEGDRVIPVGMAPDPHRSTVCDHVYCGGTFADVEWSQDGERFAFVSSSRDHKRAEVKIADASTGEVRTLFDEVEETFYESGGNWRYLSSSGQILWFSQRDDWGHLYLHDADSGQLERQVTRGAWNVKEILHVDEDRREVTFVGNGREPGDPYFEYLYRVGLDDGQVTLLTPDSANHDVSLSPDGRYFVDAASTPVTPPATTLRDRGGRAVLTLEEADISALEAAGWQPPTPFTVKARDGETDLYGLMFRPTDFDEARRYPVVNYLYPGPQSGSVGSRSFRAAHRDLQAIAELGFVVVELDAMGTPGRSKTFHEAYYGNMGDNGLPDQMAGIRQLAARHPWMDLDRVGIFGHSGGGFAAAAAIFRYPDFYHVAVSQAGNHDNRNYEDDWGEKWQGLLVERADGTTSYDNQANQLQAHNLEGKLLIAHGTTDTNVPVYNTLLVVDALIAANKDFDLVLLPNRGHGFGNEPYMMRRRWDYFVRHLLGAEPPREYEFGRVVTPRR